jgi:hypothetical protein
LPALSLSNSCSDAALGPTWSITSSHALVQGAAHGSLLRGARQKLHALQIAEALEAHFRPIDY